MSLKIEEHKFCVGSDSITYGVVPWDSEIFGFNIIEAFGIKVGDLKDFDRLITDFEHFARTMGCRMICMKIPIKEKLLFLKLQGHRYMFIEETIKPYIDCLENSNTNFERFIVYPLKKADKERIREICGIAREAFEADRFHMDTGFDAGKASERYAFWVDNSFNSDDDVLYLDIDGIVAGFSIVNISGGEARLGLIGIDNTRKGKRLGINLLAATCQYVKDKGVNEFSTTMSLNNIPALSLYSKLGFKFRDPVYVLHKWMQ